MVKYRPKHDLRRAVPQFNPIHWHGGACYQVKALKYALLLLLGIGLWGCSGNDELPEIPADTGEQQMYQEAQRYLTDRNFDLAVRSLQLLESRYPFGKYAEQAQLELLITKRDQLVR